ncbi:MAG: GIY-YIG nuclease family protein [Methylophilaceae bacterium]
MKQPAVYMLASQRNGTLYIGVTSDLIKRIWQHREGLAEGFTKEHGVKMLVWYEQHVTMESAISKEKAMKKWLREWKIKAIEQSNPDWNDLWYEINGVSNPTSSSATPDSPVISASMPVIPSSMPVIPSSMPVIPSQAGIQQNKQSKNAFSLNPLDSRLRGNDGSVEALL